MSDTQNKVSILYICYLLVICNEFGNKLLSIYFERFLNILVNLK